MQTGQVASEKGKYFGLGFEIYNLEMETSPYLTEAQMMGYARCLLLFPKQNKDW